ncbi:MAG: hypothetical protein AB1724_06420 [Thermodesulfobacteriota bacterium]
MTVSPIGGGDLSSKEFGDEGPIPFQYPSYFSCSNVYTLTALPDTEGGYVFDYWTIQTATGTTASSSTTITVPVAEDKTVTAHFVDPSTVISVYYPHVTTRSPWQTEIALVNTSSNQAVTGVLKAFSDTGTLVDIMDITLARNGRRQIIVASEFPRHAEIGYFVFVTDVNAIRGYTKLYQSGVYRTAIPAVTENNASDVYISHIASNDTFWTGISLVNTNLASKRPTITFNDGRTYSLTMAPGEHKFFTIDSLFGGQPQPDIKSGVISNAAGIIGLELFGTDTQLDGILLTDDTTSTIYYPHVADMTKWWTGIVAYNPANTACAITITPYSAAGQALTPSSVNIGAKAKYVGVVKNLGLPADTAWFKIDAAQPLSGFELFGTLDGKQLAAYAEGSGAGAKRGVFAKIEKSGWTGIAFVNTESTAASVTLTAYSNSGTALATKAISVGTHAKVVNLAENIFAPQSITNATYIAFTSSRNVVGFQLNGSSDDTMLDGLPSLK